MQQFHLDADAACSAPRCDMYGLPGHVCVRLRCFRGALTLLFLSSDLHASGISFSFCAAFVHCSGVRLRDRITLMQWHDCCNRDDSQACVSASPVQEVMGFTAGKLLCPTCQANGPTL